MFSNSRSRIVGGVALGIVALFVGTGTAFAANSGWKTSTPQTVEGLAKYTGQYLFYSAGDNHGGFRIKGTVADLNTSNNRKVKFLVKIEGYSATTYNVSTDKNLTVPAQVHWTGDQTYVENGYHQTCQVNVLGDDCTKWAHYVSPYA